MPRSAHARAAQLTGWTAEPYLVHDEVWEDALSLYRPALPKSGQRAEVTTVNGAAAAAHAWRTTRSLDRTVTMRDASCDQYTWVRVEGARQVSDLLIPAMEEPCQAAPTAH